MTEAKPTFWYLTESVVLAALKGRDTKSLIVAEVGRLAHDYKRKMKGERSMPSPQWPIERVAVRLANVLGTDAVPR